MNITKAWTKRCEVASTRVRCAIAAALSVVCGSAGGSFAADVAPRVGTVAVDHRPQPRIEGVWVWKPIYVSDLSEQDKLLSFCDRHGFNRLLVQVPWKHGTAQIVHPKAGEAPVTGTAVHPVIAYPEQLARLVTEAARHYIAVEALDGAPYMGDQVHRAETLATVDTLLAFNKTMPGDAKLAGIHWDIEPYVRADWKVMATRPPIETEYLQLLVDTKQKLRDAGSAMTLAVDIPMWYDNKTVPADNCIVTFNGQTKNFHQHIQDITDYVGIMSYRQKAMGKNSTFEHVANELAYAEQIGKFVCPAFETIQLKDTPQITFFGKTAADLQDQRHQLEAALAARPGFGGMFIHQYPSVAAMLEPADAK